MILAAAVAAIMAGSASAQTVTSTAFDQPAPAGAKVVTFDSALPNGFSLNGGQISQGDTSNSWTPAGDTTKYLVLGANAKATISADADYKTVGFYWGSINSYNTVSFLDAAGNLIGRLTGSSITSAPSSKTSAETNRYVSYTVNPSSLIAGIRSIVFESTAEAFELDNVAFSSPATVPEPATMGLFGIGLAGVSLYRRRRQRASTAA